MMDDFAPGQNPFAKDQADIPAGVNPFAQQPAPASRTTAELGPRDNSFLAEARRQLGMVARTGANVVTSPLQVGGNALAKAMNALVGQDAGGKPVFGLPSEQINKGLNWLGLPEPAPDRPIEQFTQGMAQSAPAVALPAAFAPQIVGNAAVASSLAQPGQELREGGIGAAGGAVGQGLARALGAIRQGAKPTDKALQYEEAIQVANKLAGNPPPPVLTAGQLAPKEGWLRRAEDSLAHTPLVGAPIRERQKDAMRGFQAFTRAEARPPFEGIPQLEQHAVDATTIAGLKQGFRNAYQSLLGNVKIPVARDSIDNSVRTKTALEFHSAEAEMKSEAARMMRSNDLATINEGKRLMSETKAFGESWRSKLPMDTQVMLRGVDGQYATFAPIKKASEKYASTLVVPEEYTPKDALRVLRNKSGEAVDRQKDITKMAEDIIGSTKPKNTTAGSLGLGGVGLGTFLNPTAAPYTIGGALAALGYGTKPGQAFARATQRALTADELAYVLDALRRGATPALTSATQNNP